MKEKEPKKTKCLSCGKRFHKVVPWQKYCCVGCKFIGYGKRSKK